MTDQNKDTTADVSTLATGTISGTVTDGDGNPVENATVTVLYDNTGATVAETTTDSNGEYSISTESDQIYDLRFEKLLFGFDRVEDVGVIAGEVATADATITRRDYKVRGQLDDIEDVGVFGRNTSTTGENVGILGVTDSGDDDAVGIRGVANDTDLFASTIGIEGISRAGDGVGVRGESAVGVEGVTDDGNGVYGKANASEGDGYGVVGETDSKSGRGVMGTAYDGAGGGWNSSRVDGVYGGTNRSGADDDLLKAHGVRGRSFATSGLAYGVAGEHYGREGAAVYGDANIRDGVAGVRGETTGAEYESTVCYGVEGTTEATGSDAAGVRGEALSTSGEVHGIYGETNSADGAGVVGSSTVGPALVVEGASTTSDDTPTPKEHAARIYDSSFSNSSVLAIQTNDIDPLQTSATNFVTFYDGTFSPVGAVEGDGNGTLTYTSSGADYAEYMPRVDPDEAIEAGEVVAVVDGAITKRTDDPDRTMVVTDQPVVTGNSPGQGRDARSGYETVAFTGQVPVRVRGTVEPGDVIVPSGENDGTAVALSPAEWEPGTAIVGQAWERSGDDGVSEVTVAVGIGDEDALASALTRQRETIDDVRAENETLRDRVATLENRLADLEATVAQSASADD